MILLPKLVLYSFISVFSSLDNPVLLKWFFSFENIPFMVFVFSLLLWCGQWLYFKRIYRKIQEHTDLIRKSIRQKKEEKQTEDFLSEEHNAPFHIVSHVLRERLDKELLQLEQDKFYMERDILLADLARSIGTNSRYLSMVIKEKFDKSFTQYVNELRIREVLKMFDKGMQKKMTIEGLSEMVGFNSRVTFNRAFKRFTGSTPSEYLGKLKSKEKQLLK